MQMKFLLPAGRVLYTDEREVFLREQAAGTCLLAAADSGLAGADGYVEHEEDLDELTPDYLTRIYDRHVGTPHEVVRIFAAGGELSLRELCAADYGDFLRLSAQGGEGLWGEAPEHFLSALEQYRNMSGAEREECEKAFGAQAQKNYRMLDYGLWLVQKGEKAVGLAGLMPKEDGVYLEYLLDKAYRGQGIAALVCREIIRYADEELGITVLFARTNVDNPSSKALLLRLGFSPCGENIFRYFL